MVVLGPLRRAALGKSDAATVGRWRQGAAFKDTTQGSVLERAAAQWRAKLITKADERHGEGDAARDGE